MADERMDEALSAAAELLEHLKGASPEVRETTEYWQAWASLFSGSLRIEGMLDDADRERQSQLNAQSAKKKRKKRGPSAKTRLVRRAFKCLLNYEPDITASSLCDMLDADGRLTFEDDDIEFQLVDGHVIVRDLRERAALEAATVKATSLRVYLSEQRKT